jgi:BirA family biotin operon repressor/biotin-[acetyl-CoA-carboxylase] ligase
MPQGIALLRILADGRVHSGEIIGRMLGISRAGVWKHLQTLKGQGIEIHSVPGKGYCLAGPVELLSEGQIRAALSTRAAARLSGLELHQQLDSTNSELRRRAAALSSGYACLAEAQSAGRGRHHRRWISPYARNLYLSLLWRFDAGPEALAGLSLAVGIAVLRALHRLGIREVGLKWPNDLVWRGAKCAGVLIEMTGESCGSCSVVIGVGINVSMSSELGSAIDQPWVDLAAITGQAVSRNRLAGTVISELIELLAEFERTGLTPLMEEWRRHDIVHGRPVTVLTAQGEETGVACGIDAGGALLVKNESGVRRHLSGDVRLRPLAHLPAPLLSPVGHDT